MSNHSGSYMLNHILQELEKYSVFTTLGKAKTHEFVLDIIRIGQHYDCNTGEILENIGGRLGICYYCLNEADEFDGDMCLKCSQDP